MRVCGPPKGCGFAWRAPDGLTTWRRGVPEVAWAWATVAGGRCDHSVTRGRHRRTAPAEAYGSELLVTTTLQGALRTT